MVMMDEKLVQLMVDEIVTHTEGWKYQEKVVAVRALLSDPEIGGTMTGCEKLEVVRRVRLAWFAVKR